MDNTDQIYEYVFDFSQIANNYIYDLNDNLGEFISESLKIENNKKTVKIITPEVEKRLSKVRTNLFYIAIKNHAKMTIKNLNYFSRLIIELEFDVLDFDTEKLKELFIDAIESSKFISIESRTNGKSAIIAEIGISAENE